MKLKKDERILRRQLCTQGFSFILGGWVFKECWKIKVELIFLGLLHDMSVEWKFFFVYLLCQSLVEEIHLLCNMK
jgi:hypothetical protein